MDTRGATNLVLRLQGYEGYEEGNKKCTGKHPAYIIENGLVPMLPHAVGKILQEEIWLDPLHIATNCIRKEAQEQLNRDYVKERSPIVAVEIVTSERIPFIHHFEGIFAVDDIGIWFYDGDGHIEEAIWRQYLIPWHCVRGMILHQYS
jgi:hypothetical protein